MHVAITYWPQADKAHYKLACEIVAAFEACGVTAVFVALQEDRAPLELQAQNCNIEKVTSSASVYLCQRLCNAFQNCNLLDFGGKGCAMPFKIATARSLACQRLCNALQIATRFS